VRLYLTDLEAVRTETRTETGAGTDQPVYQPVTLARRLAAIAAAHRDAGHPSPTHDPAVTAVLTGIRRARAHPPRRMRPLLLDDIRTLLTGMDCSRWPGGLTAARDSFVLLAGFVGALRRSELAALTIADLTWHPADGIHVRIRASKTDQDAAGATIVLPYGRRPQTCPPCAALRWLRLLDAATHDGRPALMRAVLATPPGPEQDPLYPHPDDAQPDDPHPDDAQPDDPHPDDAQPDDPHPDDSAQGSDEPAGARPMGPGATDSLACRAPVPELPPGMPLLRAVGKGGTLGCGRQLLHPTGSGAAPTARTTGSSARSRTS